MKEETYFNEVVCALQKALYYERGRGAYFRATRVGTDFIDQKGIEGSTSEEVIECCVTELKKSGVIENATYQKDETGNLFIFEIKGCVHLPVEAKLKKEGVPPYICPPINMILYKIGQLVNLAVETAEIEVHEGEGRCVLQVVAFERSKDRRI